MINTKRPKWRGRSKKASLKARKRRRAETRAQPQEKPPSLIAQSGLAPTWNFFPVILFNLIHPQNLSTNNPSIVYNTTPVHHGLHLQPGEQTPPTPPEFLRPLPSPNLFRSRPSTTIPRTTTSSRRIPNTNQPRRPHRITLHPQPRRQGQQTPRSHHRLLALPRPPAHRPNPPQPIPAFQEPSLEQMGQPAGWTASAGGAGQVGDQV